MIVDEYVETLWNPTNKKSYVDKGYIFTKFNNKLIVKVSDLSLKSNVKIKVKCDVCGEERKTLYCGYLKSIGNGGYYACSTKCSEEKFIKTNLKNLGVENPMQNKEIREKGIETNLKKYGFRSPMQNEEIMKKMEHTNIERYDNVCPLQNEEIKEKSKQTNLKNLGVDNPFESKEIQERIKHTNLKNLNVEHPMQNEDVKKKTAQTNIEKYNNICPLQNEEIKEKSRQTNLKKFGFGNPMQNKTVNEKAQETKTERYGEVYSNYLPKYNPNSIIYLDLISERLCLNIQHALNGSEKKFIRFYSDGYIELFNISLEWDERHHKTKRQKERDIKKEQFLLEKFNCPTIRINEKEFLKDIEKGISLIISKIDNYIDSITVNI